jgi:hypothetical protein
MSRIEIDISESEKVKPSKFCVGSMINGKLYIFYEGDITSLADSLFSGAIMALTEEPLVIFSKGELDKYKDIIDPNGIVDYDC